MYFGKEILKTYLKKKIIEERFWKHILKKNSKIERSDPKVQIWKYIPQYQIYNVF